VVVCRNWCVHKYELNHNDMWVMCLIVLLIVVYKVISCLFECLS